MSDKPPETLSLDDDGDFPNSRLPVLIYRSAMPGDADQIETRLRNHHWSNAWRNGVYSYHHYHSTSHEVLVVYAGQAQLRLGGPKLGQSLELKVGDLLVIPAGVAHQCVQASSDFAVVGAYADGRDWDLQRGRPGERPAADGRIAQVPLPSRDPVHGEAGPLEDCWRAGRENS